MNIKIQQTINTNIHEEWRKQWEKPQEEWKREQKAKRLADCEKLYKMAQTQGWREIIGPMLEELASQDAVFSLVRNEKLTDTQRHMELGAREGMRRLLVLVGKAIAAHEENQGVQRSESNSNSASASSSSKRSRAS